MSDYRLTDREFFPVKVPRHLYRNNTALDLNAQREMLKLKGEIKNKLERRGKASLKIPPEYRNYRSEIEKISRLIELSGECPNVYFFDAKCDFVSEIFIDLMFNAQTEHNMYFDFIRRKPSAPMAISMNNHLPNLDMLYSCILKCDAEFFMSRSYHFPENLYNHYRVNPPGVIRVWLSVRDKKNRSRYTAAQRESYDRYGAMYMDIMIKITALTRRAFNDRDYGIYSEFSALFNTGLYTRYASHYEMLKNAGIFLPAEIQEAFRDFVSVEN